MKRHNVAGCTAFAFLAISLGFVFISAFVFSIMEDDWDFTTSMYFTIITMTTIGYGDLAPTTKVSRIYTMVFIFVSLFMLFAIFQAIITYFIDRQVYRVKQRIYNRVNTAMTDASLLDDHEIDMNIYSTNKCLNKIYNFLFNSTSAIFFYLLLYLGWLTCWTFYFTQWNNSQSQHFTFFEAIYFGIVTSSTVGYGDFTPYIVGEEPEFEAKLFTLGCAIIGVVLLATLASKVSTILIKLLLRIFSCKCCQCVCNNDNISEIEDDLQLSKETILNIKKNGSIDLRTFLAIQYSKDSEFVSKLEAGCDLFEKFDSDGNNAIEFEELKKEYRKQRQIKQQQQIMKDYLVNNENGQTELQIMPEPSFG